MKQKWIRRRWLDFRHGHGMYLIFMMAFANFILIFYRLLIERVEFLDQIFSNLWFFAIIFVIIYVPIAVLIGFWHRRTQMKVETEQLLRQNPFFAKWIRILLDLQTGRASKEEVEALRKLLISIEKGKGSFSDS